MEIGEKGELVEHNGKQYRFCGPACRWAFENNPDQFVGD
jgi:YHS domain-containing protein